MNLLLKKVEDDEDDHVVIDDPNSRLTSSFFRVVYDKLRLPVLLMKNPWRLCLILADKNSLIIERT
jgi:hypothetical protein